PSPMRFSRRVVRAPSSSSPSLSLHDALPIYGGAIRVEATGEKLWPETLDIMGWSVDPEGFGVIFQRTIPDFVTENMGPAVNEILDRKSTRLNSSHQITSYAVSCLKKKN